MKPSLRTAWAYTGLPIYILGMIIGITAIISIAAAQIQPEPSPIPYFPRPDLGALRLLLWAFTCASFRRALLRNQDGVRKPFIATPNLLIGLLLLGTQLFVFARADNLVAATRAEFPIWPYFRATLFAFHDRCYDWHLKPPMCLLMPSPNPPAGLSAKTAITGLPLILAPFYCSKG